MAEVIGIGRNCRRNVETLVVGLIVKVEAAQIIAEKVKQCN